MKASVLPGLFRYGGRRLRTHRSSCAGPTTSARTGDVMTDVTQPRSLSFGDNVRVRTSPTTTARGVAGLVGQVFGQTTPSATNVEVIGELVEDYAVNVNLSEVGEALWFTEDLLELVDHAPGTEIRLDGIPKKWTRTEDGQWAETPASPQTASAHQTADRERPKPWWKFW